MSRDMQKTTSQAQPQFEDEFGLYLAGAQQDPQFRAAYEDAVELQKILDSLVSLRKALGLSQTAVADRMGVRQPTVSGFETEASDPRLSTLQRYARAVEGRLKLSLDLPATCDWVTVSTASYPNRGAAQGEARAEIQKSDLARNWRLPKASSYALAA